jgi:hypothetical protein
MREWALLSDTDLLTEVRKKWSNVTAATRDEMMRFLVLDFVEKTFDCQ